MKEENLLRWRGWDALVYLRVALYDFCTGRRPAAQNLIVRLVVFNDVVTLAVKGAGVSRLGGN